MGAISLRRRLVIDSQRSVEQVSDICETAWEWLRGKYASGTMRKVRALAPGQGAGGALQNSRAET